MLGALGLVGAASSSADPPPLLLPLAAETYPSRPLAEDARVKDPYCSVCACSVATDFKPEEATGELVVRVLSDTSTSVLDANITELKRALAGGEPTSARSRPEPLLWQEHVVNTLKAVKLDHVGIDPSTLCIPFGVCTIGERANRESPLAQAILDEEKLARAHPKKRRLVVFLTDGRQWLKRERLNQCTNESAAPLREAIQKLIALRHVRLVILRVDGTGCPGPLALCPGSPNSKAEDTRCREIAHTLDKGKSLSAEVARKLIADLDALVVAQTSSFFPHTLYKTIPEMRFSDVVLVGDDKRYRCSGVVLDPRTVLTAGHCSPATRVRFGEAQEEQGATIMVASTARHPHEDLALLRTKTIMPAPAKLRRNASDSAPPGGVLRHVGFGAIDAFGERGFGRKKILDLPVSGWGCDGARAAQSGCRPGSELVIVASAGRDTCRGDSGGPLYELIGDGKSCAFRLVGVTSRRTADATTPCGGGGIYVRVDAVDGWIRDQGKRWEEEEGRR